MSLIAPPTRTHRKRERTRGEIVAAAERLVSIRGIDAISIDDITQEADVAKGTFYTHFEDKEDLAVVIGTRLRVELEGQITARNKDVTDPAQRMANGLSTVLAFAIVNPVRARAMLRLRSSAFDPDASINAGIRNDLALGLKGKRFWAASLNAALIVTIGTVMSAMSRITDAINPLASPHAFSIEVVTTVLVALGMEKSAAARISTLAMNDRRKEP